MTSEALDLTPDECPGCNDAILRVQRTGEGAVCAGCGDTYLPSATSAAPAPVARLVDLDDGTTAPFTPAARDVARERLILVLRDLGHLRQLARDSDPACVVPRSMYGGNPLQSVVGREAPQIHDVELRRKLKRLLRLGDDEESAKARHAFVDAIERTRLPGDPADDFDPVAARAAEARLAGAPEPHRSVLAVMRSVMTSYELPEVVAARVADALAPEDLRACWAASDRDVPSPEVWGGALVEDALAWWFQEGA